MFQTNNFDLTFCIFLLHSLTYKADCSQNNGQVYIQTDNELRFMVDGIPLPISTSDSLIFTQSEQRNHGQQDHRLPLIFTPSMLDFDTQSVGMPSLRRVTVTNRLESESIHLLSISGSTAHFHCSFFKDKVIQPGRNTTFDVVFLARQLGDVEHALKVQTDRGVFMYHVFGVGKSNPFRLKPLLPARVPVNGSYSPVISMHNPFSDSLQVVEMFSSGGNLHLELPTGAADATRNMWEIAPFQTKPVMRATYLAKKIVNETGFIRIRTKSQQGEDDVLIVPLEVEVSGEPGLYSPQNVLDFGVLHSRSGLRSLPLFVINSSTRPVEIAKIVTEPVNGAIDIEIQPMHAVEGGIDRMSMVAMVTYNAQKSQTASGRVDKGSVVIVSKEGQRLCIPYQADVHQGTLLVDLTSELTVQTSEIELSSDLTRRLHIRSTLNRPLAIYNVTIPSQPAWLKMVDTKAKLILEPNGRLELTKLVINSVVKRIHGAVTTYVNIYTNISTFRAPVHIYDGKLQTVFQHNNKELDFGSLGFGERRELFFTLRNNNPVNVEISDIYSTSAVTQVTLFGVEEGKGSTLTRPPNLSSIEKDPLVLRPNHFAVYRVKLTAPKSEGNYLVDIRVVTNYDTFYVPLKFRTTEGSVRSIPEKIVFEQAFPTKIPFKVLKIRSSFVHYTEVTKVSFLPSDDRFRYESTKNTPTVLEPFQDTVIGHVYFDANNGSLNDSYVGLPLNSPGGLNWIAGLSLAPDTDRVDSYLYSKFRNRWLAMQHRSSVNVTVQVDTEWIQNFLFPAQAHLIWPSLLPAGNRLRFPPTQVGNLTTLLVAVENPSHSDVTIQVLPLPLYPNPKAIVDLLMAGSDLRKLRSLVNYEEGEIFTLQNLEKYNRKTKNPVPTYRQAVKESFGVMPHLGSISTTLSRGIRISVSIGFQPKIAKSYVSLILVRNNLTVVDALIVSGKGAASGLRVKETDDGEYLNYEIKENSLKTCSTNAGSMPSDSSIYELSHTFTLHNNGTLPVYIQGFELDGVPCSHQSFRVVNCEGFELAPNKSKMVELIYSPDFSTSSIMTRLLVRASNNLDKNLTVSIDIPAHLLKQCRQSLPRPEWEVMFFWAAVVMMCFLLIVSLLLAYADMKRIFAVSLYAAATRNARFDLRQLSEAKQNGTSNHIKSSPGSTGSQESRRRNRTTELLNNGTASKSQTNETGRLQGNLEKRNSAKQLQPQDVNSAETKKQTGARSKNLPASKPTEIPNPSIASKSAKMNNNNASTPSKPSPPTSLASTKVTNNLMNGHTHLKATKQSNSSVQATPKDSEELTTPKSDTCKHDHKNNLLSVDNSTTTNNAVNSDDEEEVTNVGCGVEEVEKDSPVKELPSPALNEEARAKLQQNSRAQLKKQQKKNNQPKQRAKKTSTCQPPAMVTKAVGTADFEDSNSLSTDSGSANTVDGKDKKVSEWLHKLPVRANGHWGLSHHSQPSDHMSVSSEAPSWDTVGPEAYDDLSVLADQTKDFAENAATGIGSSQTVLRAHGPIGTKPQRPRFNSNWDFPPASSDSVRPIASSPLVTPPPVTNMSSNDTLGRVSVDSLLKSNYAEDRERREKINPTQRSSQGLNSWSDSLRDGIWSSNDWNPASSIWNTSQWAPWSPSRSSNDMAGLTGTPSTGLGLAAPATSSSPVDFGLFSSSVWSTPSANSGSSSNFQMPSDGSVWTYEQASGDGSTKDQ